MKSTYIVAEDRKKGKKKLNSEARIPILSESGKMEGEKKGTHL